MQQKVHSWFIPMLTMLAVFAAIGLAVLGSGAFGGTPINQAADGALSADATPLAPAGPAFSIWSIIYAGLLGYAIYQLLPAQRQGSRHAERHGQLRPWAALSAVLNAVWIAVVQAGVIWASVLIILAAGGSGSHGDDPAQNSHAHQNRCPAHRRHLWPVFGLVCVATTANIAAWIATFGVRIPPVAMGWCCHHRRRDDYQCGARSLFTRPNRAGTGHLVGSHLAGGCSVGGAVRIPDHRLGRVTCRGRGAGGDRRHSHDVPTQ